MGDYIVRAMGGQGQIRAFAATTRDMVEKARQAARPGEVVVLSPGGTSFDHYTQYSVRGRHFKTLVNDLK